MKFLILIAFLCFDYGTAVEPSINSSSIVGGYRVLINDFPSAARLTMVYGVGHKNGSCDGTLIAPKFVLTAGHCLIKGPISVIIGVGSTQAIGGVFYSTSTYTVHPSFVNGEPDYDIAVVDVGSNIVYVRKATLPATLADERIRIPVGSVLTVIGWGRLSETITARTLNLRAVKVPVIDIIRCQTIYRGQVTVTERSFCAGDLKGGHGTCLGDSGGPAFNKEGLQVGIVGGAEGCSRPNFPAVYTNIVAPAIRAWIRRTASV